MFSVQNPRPLDILVGTDFLDLLPKCIYGFNCKSCRKRLCCYKRRLGFERVPIGQCDNIEFTKVCCHPLYLYAYKR